MHRIDMLENENVKVYVNNRVKTKCFRQVPETCRILNVMNGPDI